MSNTALNVCSFVFFSIDNECVSVAFDDDWIFPFLSEWEHSASTYLQSAMITAPL